MGVSGVEAIVAAASPFIGQGESACLVKPYVSSFFVDFISFKIYKFIIGS